MAGNHTLAILKTTENYYELRSGLMNIAQEVMDVSKINMNGEQYTIEYFLSGDWKFLAIVLWSKCC